MDEFSLSTVSQWRGLHRTDQTLYALFSLQTRPPTLAQRQRATT